MNIYYWASDKSFNTGEGILANQFIKEVQRINTNYKLISINKKLKSENNLIGKYIMPIYGILKIWQHTLNGRKTCFINYLPLWNFIIFLLLPKKTILGPITGTIIPRKYDNLLNFLKFISIKIILIKFQNVLLATNFFINYFKNKCNLYSNFIFSEFKFNNIRLNKKYDFIIYNRKHETKGNDFTIEIVKLLAKKKFKIAVLGDQIKNISNNIKNHGYIKRKFAKKIIAQSRYSLSSAENLYSFFTQDCLSENLIVFYNSYFKNYCHFFKEQLVPLNYSNAIMSFAKIVKRIGKINKNKINGNTNFNIYFENYFKNLV